MGGHIVFVHQLIDFVAWGNDKLVCMPFECQGLHGLPVREVGKQQDIYVGVRACFSCGMASRKHDSFDNGAGVKTVYGRDGLFYETCIELFHGVHHLSVQQPLG